MCTFSTCYFVEHYRLNKNEVHIICSILISTSFFVAFTYINDSHWNASNLLRFNIAIHTI